MLADDSELLNPEPRHVQIVQRPRPTRVEVDGGSRDYSPRATDRNQPWEAKSMYQSLNRRRGKPQAAGTLARQIAAGFHVGTYRDFLRCHVLETARIVKCPKTEQREYLTSLLDRVQDERNLRSTIDHMDQHSGTASGPDRIYLSDVAFAHSDPSRSCAANAGPLLGLSLGTTVHTRAQV